MKQPLIIAITGPSDIGKGVIVDKLVQFNDGFKRVVSHTDRPKRKLETHGEEYFFMTEEEFSQMIENEEFIEWQVVPSNGYRYGKTRQEMEKALESHADKIILTRINVINLPVFKRHYPHAKSIFIDLETQALIDVLKNHAEIEAKDEFERRYKFATEERRRRHLADITITRKDKDEDIIEDIVRFISRHQK